MKKQLALFAACITMLTACSWQMTDQEMIDNTLPNSATPRELVGEWVSGYTSLPQVVDAYDGHSLGTTWASGKYFKLTGDGKNAEACFLSKSQCSYSATKVVGTVRFDPESTTSRGSFTLLALGGHYKSWGGAAVDRDATPEELKENLTRKYHYRTDGGWLRIEPGGEPTDSSSNFRKAK